MANAKADSTQVAIGDAWGVLRGGNAADAVNRFKQIIQSVPDSIDAHYGLGLAQHAAGQKQAAAGTFEQALKMLGSVTPEGKDERDRYMMLNRMINQRLTEAQA